MKHLFVPYELALKVKEKGFDEPCLRVYCERYKINPKTGGDIKTGEFYLTDKPSEKTRCKAPLYQQVIDWLLSKGVIVRIDSKGIGYEVKAVEWEDYAWYDTKGKAIEEALKLI